MQLKNVRHLAAFLLLVCAVAAAQVPADIEARIRQEETNHSQVMRTEHFFTDVYGARLTGSPAHKAAAEWAVKQMMEWGFQNGHLEPWDFGHPGWMNLRASGYMTAPTLSKLDFRVLGWTNSTKGTVSAAAINIVPPEKPKQPDMDTFIASVKDKVRGKIVLVGKWSVVPVTFDPRPLRMDDKAAHDRFDPNNPRAGQFPERQRQQPEPGQLTGAQINEQIDAMLVANGALLRLNDAHMDHGLIRAFKNRTYDGSKTVPTVVLRSDDFGRIARILDDGTPVSLEFNIQNQWYPEGKTSYNAVAEIPGTDKKDEVVMLGGHLDSWHSATGATDNAIGAAVMMEAARILQAIGVKPRRTIRVGLWGGEEEGLLGSQAYVAQHFGTYEDQKPEFSKLVAYLNVDSGTGRIRGASIFGPKEDADILRTALEPLSDLGFAGAIANTSRRLGGTDSTSFAKAGLPGIGLGQDPIEYFNDTWHTNIDTYERIVEPDVKTSAIIVASALYELATRDDQLPRFTTADMPPLPKEGEPPARPATTATPASGSNK
ncbi:MAG: M20/M25/M40 family metallo-hydrolase [Terriglobales bacterium]